MDERASSTARTFGANAAARHVRRLFVSMKTTTIRVPVETRDRLEALARTRGVRPGEVVADLVREADDRALLADAEESWQRMAADARALAAYRGDR
ncbi:MAG: hypothetical protein WD249_08935 [Gaiellaceae bacterium]